jgi:hypothetical protein
MDKKFDYGLDVHELNIGAPSLDIYGTKIGDTLRLTVIDMHELKIGVQLSIYRHKLGNEISLDIHWPNIDVLSLYIYRPKIYIGIHR